MKKKEWSKIVLLGGLVASVLVGLLFSEDAATVIANISDTFILYPLVDRVVSPKRKSMGGFMARAHTH